MKISAGISEISLTRMQDNRVKTDKVYLWPQYGDGRVNRIRGVIKRTDSNGIYSKPFNEDRDKVLSRYSTYQREYNSKGNVLKRNLNAQPGMLFDALA